MLSIIFPLALLVFSLVLIINSAGYPAMAKFFPRVILFPLSGMLLWQTIKEVLKIKKRKISGAKAKHSTDREEFIPAQKYFIAIGWMLGFLAALYVWGLIAGIAIWLFLYMKLNGEKWFMTVGATLFTIALFYFFLGMVLQMYMYEGIIFPLFSGIFEQ